MSSRPTAEASASTHLATAAFRAWPPAAANAEHVVRDGLPEAEDRQRADLTQRRGSRSGGERRDGRGCRRGGQSVRGGAELQGETCQVSEAGRESSKSRECHHLTGPQPCSPNSATEEGPESLSGPSNISSSTSAPASPCQQHARHESRAQPAERDERSKGKAGAPHHLCELVRGGDAQRFDRRVAHAAVVAGRRRALP
eukprot:COSAG04_NODE_2074_length_4862_cov_2.968927_4_plen_199_part_00